MLDFYQNLPQYIDPIAFSIGFFSIRWYSLMYILAFFSVYVLLRWRVARDTGNLKFPIFNFQIQDSKARIKSFILDFVLYAIGGLLIGGRLGYVLIYNPQYYWQNPLAIISPYDFAGGIWTGISGMSYFGGSLGVIFASWLFVRQNKINFWSWADFVVPAIPAGYFFGRIGNFLNGELYGKLTEKFWGVHFKFGDLALRHPSQFYEAFFEGLVLFLILWPRRNKFKFAGESLAIYLFFYGLFRFGIEFFREIDFGSALLFGVLTIGQVMALIFMVAGLLLGMTLSKVKNPL